MTQAKNVLLDDVLSALDVHTARAVVNNCLTGALLKGRTVILVTHNVALAGKHAQFFVSIGSDGSISTSDSVADALVGDPDLLAMEVDAIEKIEEIVDETKAPKAEGQKASGKLVLAEEIALGRVTMRARKFAL